MSKPTIIMIAHASADDGIDRLGLSLTDRLGINGQMTRVDSVAPGWDEFTRVHIGSFNHLDEPLFLELLRNSAWKYPHLLQLFIEREDDSAFTEYDVFGRMTFARLAEHARNRGGLPHAPAEQRKFFEHLSSEMDTARETDEPWLFEVLAIHKSYYFEANSRIVPYDKSTALMTDGYSRIPLDLAFDGFGIRMLCDHRDSDSDRGHYTTIKNLNPGDRIFVEGKIRFTSQKTAEIFSVRSISVAE